MAKDQIWIDPNENLILMGWLRERGHAEAEKGFFADMEQFHGFIKQSRKLHSDYSEQRHEAWAAYTCWTFGKEPSEEARAEIKITPEQVPFVTQAKLLRETAKKGFSSILGRLPEKRERITLWVWRGVLLAVLLALLVVQARGQGVPHSPLVIDLENATVSQAIRAGGLIRLNCGANLTCVWDTANNRFTMDAGVGGSISWDGISNPIAAQALAMASFTTTHTWGTATGAADLWVARDGLNNTGTGTLLHFYTQGTSTMIPFKTTARGTVDGARLSTAGLFEPIGAGKIIADRKEVPTGALNGINLVFDFTRTINNTVFRLFWNGLVLEEGGSDDYTITGPSQITMALAPITGDKIFAYH